MTRGLHDTNEDTRNSQRACELPIGSTHALLITRDEVSPLAVEAAPVEANPLDAAAPIKPTLLTTLSHKSTICAIM